MATSRVMSLLLQEAIEIAEQVARSKSGVPTEVQYRRSLVIFPYLVSQLQNGYSVVLNRELNPLGIATPGAVSEDEWHLHTDVCVKDAPALSSALEHDGRLYGGPPTPNPWRTRAQMRQYARRMRLLAAAIGVEVE
jgi:hypothetical protein